MNVAFRADASPEIGTGHVTRCLTLAEALSRQGARIRFVSRQMPQHLQLAVRRVGGDCVVLDPAETRPDRALAHGGWLGASREEDAVATSRALDGDRWDWLVVDHYGIDAAWEQRVRATGRHLMVIDDLADRVHDCDVLLDQNYYEDAAQRYDGKVPAHCRRLVGPAFALLRKDFADAHRAAAARDGVVDRILVFFGGFDSANMTATAVEALAQLHHADVDVVIGAGHLQRDAIERACEAHRFTLHVETTNMAELCAGASLAVGVGGVALWERCSVGLPSLTFVAADNHRRQVDHAARLGLVYAPLPERPTVDAIVLHLRALFGVPSLRRLISQRGLDTVDGAGADRVARVLRAGVVTVRPAVAADSARVHLWRNHESVRAVSRSQAPIEQSEHALWFDRVLANSSRQLMIGESATGEAIGAVRFDLEAERAEVSIYLAPEHQGRGLGPALLLAAEQALASRSAGTRVVTAEVLAGNDRSMRLFEKCGYVPDHTGFIKRLDR